MSEFLLNSRGEFVARCERGGLIEYADLGTRLPWLWRLTFRTRGLVREADGEVRQADHHTVALRFLPDYLRQVNSGHDGPDSAGAGNRGGCTRRVTPQRGSQGRGASDSRTRR
jgi:hypothetical protein